MKTKILKDRFLIRRVERMRLYLIFFGVAGGELILQGTVKRWLTRKGFGFIEPEAGGEDIFIHYSDIQGAYELREGQRVEFEVQDTYKGPKAINLTIIE